MKQFIIRTDNLETLNELSYEERGKLLTILMLNATDTPSETQIKELRVLGTEFSTDRFLKQSLAPFISDFNEDKEKYEKIAARNRANGAKGGRPRKTQSVKLETQSVVSKPTKTSYNGLSTINLNNKIYITLEEVLAEAEKCCITQEVATRFFYYYDAQGWQIGDRPIVNWRSKLMEWKNNQQNFSSHANNNTNNAEFSASRGQQLAEATRAAIASSQRGVTTQFDSSVL